MFILRGHRRCGTEMLRTALDSHTQITCHDELVHVKHMRAITELGLARYLQSYRMRTHDGFVANSHIAEGGIELQQIIQQMWSAAALFSFPVVALRRRDLIRRAASDVIATTTGVHRVMLDSKPNRTQHTLVMTPEQLVRSADAAQRAFDATGVLFPMACVVVYEELLTDWDKQMARIFEYIGVENQIVGAATRRQEVRKIRDIVYNYDELKDQLYGTHPYLFDIAEQTDALFD